MTDTRYERMKIMGVMADAKNRVEYYRDVLAAEENRDKDDEANLEWAKETYTILSEATSKLLFM